MVFFKKLLKTMKKYLFSFVIAAICLTPSCSRFSSENTQSVNESNQSTKIFINKVTSLHGIYGTKSGDLSEEDAVAMMVPLLEASKDYLQSNYYYFEEDFETPDDPRISWVALAVAEYDMQMSNQTKTTLGGCVLEALGVRDVIDSLGKAALKKIAKVVAKQALKRAIPYVGAAITAYAFVDCMLDE